MKKTAITGIGVISPYGIGVECLCEGINNKTSAIDDLTLFEPSGSIERAAEVEDFDHNEYIFSTQPYVDRATSFAICAARQALDNAEIALPLNENSEEIGCVCGTCWGAFSSIERFSKPILAGKAKTAQGLVFTHSFPNAFASVLAIEFGLKGYSTVSAGNPLAGIWALDNACAAIENNLADRILVGASEAISETLFAHYESSGEITSKKPLGEGAVFFMLESEQSMESRNIKPKGYISCEINKTPENSQKVINCLLNTKETSKPENLSTLYGENLSVNPLMAAAYALSDGSSNIGISLDKNIDIIEIS